MNGRVNFMCLKNFLKSDVAFCNILCYYIFGGVNYNV